ncbi:MAG: hypothetical protein E7H98_04555 [Finegoldia magna]|nr:hypothetical protein [Finegoldia magna]
MKTKEFIKKVKELGFTIEYYKNPFSNIKSNCAYDLITISANNQVLVKVWTNCQYAISTISDGHSSCLSGYDVDKLYKLCFEYASTPVEDREEEEKFLIQHKYLVSKNLLPVNLAWNKLKDVYRSINLKVNNHIYQAQFTFKEYEEIKKKLNTDLADFELVEVEDDNQRS